MHYTFLKTIDPKFFWTNYYFEPRLKIWYWDSSHPRSISLSKHLTISHYIRKINELPSLKILEVNYPKIINGSIFSDRSSFEL